jgi:hypothetical protein
LSVTTPEMLAALVPWAAAPSGSTAMIANATRIQLIRRVTAHGAPHTIRPQRIRHSSTAGRRRETLKSGSSRASSGDHACIVSLPVTTDLRGQRMKTDFGYEVNETKVSTTFNGCRVQRVGDSTTSPRRHCLWRNISLRNVAQVCVPARLRSLIRRGDHQDIHMVRGLHYVLVGATKRSMDRRQIATDSAPCAHMHITRAAPSHE